MDAAVTELAERILDSLPFDPNDQQTMLIAALARFVAAPAPACERVFVPMEAQRTLFGMEDL